MREFADLLNKNFNNAYYVKIHGGFDGIFICKLAWLKWYFIYALNCKR